MYKPYMSDNKGQDADKKPQYFQTTGGQQALEKVTVFYNNVPMPCVVAEPVELFPNAKKPKYLIISDAIHEAFLRLMEETTDYKKAAHIVRILEKSALRLLKTYLKTSGVTVDSIKLGIICLSRKAQKAGKPLIKSTDLTY
ncbi:hypothetical protein DSO57_1037924 [Entomophthora muscae]|uniref:Uncharacterized protein n=1 Tax=Entomophthora muscae TaxID=34485 RepID=A0ACC2SNH2_9FUNG|nr:hypothetical protein DSO57_1037924 [Entomophthora muscae]